MKIRGSVMEAVQKLGYKKLREAQIQPINDLMDGKDILLIAPTSMGKSAVFQVPGLARAKQKPGSWVLVIEPTLALIHDQVRRLQEKGASAACLTGENTGNGDTILSQVRRGEITFLFTTPEQLQSHKSRSILVPDHDPWLVVVDEAHCLTDWGSFHFRPAYQNMKHRPVVAAMTATAPMGYRIDIVLSLGMKEPKLHCTSLARPNLRLVVRDYTLDTSVLDSLPVSKREKKRQLEKLREKTLQNKLKEAVRLIKKYGSGGSVILYATTRNSVEFVYNNLKEQEELKGQVVKYHSGMTAEKKNNTLGKFLSGKKRIIVATSAFGMGIDKEDVRLVLHFELPLSPVEWYQQIGRAGRDGRDAHVVLFYQEDDIKQNRAILAGKKTMREIEKLPDTLQPVALDEMESSVQKLEALVDLLHQDSCLMQGLLQYLGEWNAPVCGCCSICQRNRKKKGV